MIDRMTLGTVPPKAHQALLIDGPGGAPVGDTKIAYEHCFTRRGFDDAYTILYHRHSPARESHPEPSNVSWRRAEPSGPAPVERIHFLSNELETGGTWLESRTPLLVNPDVVISVARPDRDESRFFANADGDELLFFFKGGATLETPFGIQQVHELDYVLIPKATPYRLHLEERLPEDGGPHHVLILEGRGGWHIPKQFRNPAGQLTFDAPYTHRDFGRPTELVDVRGDPTHAKKTGWTITTKKDDVLVDRRLDTHPCDVLGWDGTVYPITFPILAYNPKTGKYHLPPTIHLTFATRDGICCSFVPRKVDYGEGAVPCPYPHSSVDCDEMLFYVRGNFTSRTGVGPGSLSLHPSGLPHGPQPGAYERSLGHEATDELAVMMDTFKPLYPTIHAADIEDPDYMESWSAARFDAAAATAHAHESKSDGDPDSVSQ